jgi:hypothetical protein
VPSASALPLALLALVAAKPHIVFGDRSAGGIVAAHTTAAQATALYGAPSTSHERGSTCTRTWRGAGLTVGFLSFEGAPCTKGVAITITVRGSSWRTARGLRIGDPVMRVHDLFPSATHHADGWWLVTRHACAEVGGHAFAGLRATTSGGRVGSLVITAGVCD